jgi:hypothetical protein
LHNLHAESLWLYQLWDHVSTNQSGPLPTPPSEAAPSRPGSAGGGGNAFASAYGLTTHHPHHSAAMPSRAPSMPACVRGHTGTHLNACPTSNAASSSCPMHAFTSLHSCVPGLPNVACGESHPPPTFGGASSSAPHHEDALAACSHAWMASIQGVLDLEPPAAPLSVPAPPASSMSQRAAAAAAMPPPPSPRPRSARVRIATTQNTPAHSEAELHPPILSHLLAIAISALACR